MSLLRRLTSTITGYLVLYAGVTQEIGRLAADFFSSRWLRFRGFPLAEQAFALITGIVIIFTFLPWRSYTIRFGEDAPRRHGIYSDDFALILVGCLIAMLPFVWALLPREPYTLRKAQVWRYLGLGIVFVFALWNWINPQRIAETKEAAFAWSFYVFQAVAALWVMSGILGGRTYAQYPDKN